MHTMNQIDTKISLIKDVLAPEWNINLYSKWAYHEMHIGSHVFFL